MEEDKLKKALSWVVKLVNKRVNFNDLKKRYWPDEDRTLLIKVIGKDYSTGIVLDTTMNEITLVDPGGLKKVTVTAVMSEETFWRCMLGKMSIAEGFFDRMHPIALDGDATLRDMKIFIVIEQELRKAFEDIWKEVGR